MENAKTCCFIGHSNAPEGIAPRLVEEVERHIVECGVTEFLVGNYGQFDRMSAAAVKEAKKQHPEVTLFLMLPYLPEQGRPLPDMDGYDGTIYPEGMEKVPPKLAIPRLNRITVQKSDYVIAYVTHSWGGAAKTLEQAQKRENRGEFTITNLYCGLCTKRGPESHQPHSTGSS